MDKYFMIYQARKQDYVYDATMSCWSLNYNTCLHKHSHTGFLSLMWKLEK